MFGVRLFVNYKKAWYHMERFCCPFLRYCLFNGFVQSLLFLFLFLFLISDLQVVYMYYVVLSSPDAVSLSIYMHDQYQFTTVLS